MGGLEARFPPNKPVTLPLLNAALTQDTVTGFLLAGTGQRDKNGNNFFIVDPQSALTDALVGHKAR